MGKETRYNFYATSSSDLVVNHSFVTPMQKDPDFITAVVCYIKECQNDGTPVTPLTTAGLVLC